MEKLKIEIDQRVENIIKSIDEELKGNQEFNGYLVADKKNVWRIIDLIIPKQEVTGASVDEEKGKNMPSQYEEKFLEFFNRKDNKVIIGTMHSHNSMGSFQSGADTTDVDNHAYINLNAKLPFIDMVWSHEDCKVWVTLKINNGMGKRVFQIGDVEIEPVESEDGKKIIEALEKKGYDVDERLFSKAVTQKMNVKEYLKNIKIKTYDYEKLPWYINDKRKIPEELIFEGDLEPKIKIEHWKKKHLMVIKVWGDPEQLFSKELDIWIDENGKEFETKVVSAETGKRYWQVGLLCKDKVTFWKLQEEILETFEQFYIMKSEYDGSGFDDYGYKGGYRG